MKEESAVDPASQVCRLRLPPRPPGETGAVAGWSEPVAMMTYSPAPPDRNPMFFETRVYQGSRGAIYPMPLIDRVAVEPKLRMWQAIHLENEWLRIMILPEIGGRIHVGFDKVNGYDFFYRQNVIKPALVGLAGPWISGGVEFNWPQHHRPATFLPVNTEIEKGGDGSVTVWCSDHDPFTRMKGAHGVCLYPDRSYLELKVRLFNRTQTTQTFLWWANMAARVHERYQSFFPPDVTFVTDHAKRAIAKFPLCDRDYYGVRYAERAERGVPAEEAPARYRPDGSYPPNDLSWYANIPVPTSYMVAETQGEFFGGYDHAAQAGVTHVANRFLSPGKKQWTWGNHEFGYAWERSLTDADGPYVELMAGVYSDNQPDFSFLAPWETKKFSQFWYPIRAIGVPQAANLDAALSLAERPAGTARIGVAVTRAIPDATIRVTSKGKLLHRREVELGIRDPLVLELGIPPEATLGSLEIEICDPSGSILRYAPAEIAPAGAPQAAVELPAPEKIGSVEQLYLAGVHLEQYRHATRAPEPYWQEALRRDPGESRSHVALGQWRLRRGELASAERHFRSAIERLTERNPNPANSEAFYYLGITLRYLGRWEEAYAALYKATWVASLRAPAYLALAELDARARRWTDSLQHLRRSLEAESDNNNARNLTVVILRELGRHPEADAALAAVRGMDRLDIWARHLDLGECPADSQQCIDLALDFARCGLNKEALQALGAIDLTRRDGAAPMAAYFMAALHEANGEPEAAERWWRRAVELVPEYVFPHRIEEMLLLEDVCRRRPGDPRAPYYLGNFLYDRRRYDEAIQAWELAAARDASFPTVWRNLGLAYFNVRGNPEKAMLAYDKALEAAPCDARVLYERDQLWKRAGQAPVKRLAEMNRHPDLIASRDDLALEFATLLNQTGDPSAALRLLTARPFQPWEGGEGMVLAQYVRAALLTGKRLLRDGRCQEALLRFQSALDPPHNLSEAWHLLANSSEVYFWIGMAERGAGNESAARRAFERAARQRGDFRGMSVKPMSDRTYWSAAAMRKLGENEQAAELFRSIVAYAETLEKEAPQIDYFATSLPSMLLFKDDLQRRRKVEVLLLRAQGSLGLGDKVESERLLRALLALDGNHAAAADLMEDLRWDAGFAGAS